MATAQIGKKVPAFKADATGEQVFRLADAKGKNLVIYFYPKDATPGCTLEGQDFRDSHAKFKRNKTLVIGVSRDSINSHEKFKAKQEFPFELLSDPDEKLCKLFDVIKEKNMYGPDGKLRREWRKVKVAGHVDEVLEAVRELNRGNA